MKSSLALLLVTISAPSLAVAQDMSGGVTLGFGQHSVESEDLSTATLDGRVDFAFANGMTFGVEAGYIDVGVDGTSFDLSGTNVELDVGYKLANGLSFGAYAGQTTIDAGLGIDLSLKSIGAEVGYTTGDWDLGLSLGRTSTSPDIAMMGIDIDNVGLTVKYAAMPNLDIGGAFLRATLSNGVEDLDIDLVGLAAAYDINEQFSLFGGVSRTSVEILDVTTMGLGVGYDLSQMTGMASVVSLELARTELEAMGSSTDLDTVRIGLTLPLGGKGTEAPLNSVADSIFNPRHGAVNAALTGAF